MTVAGGGEGRRAGQGLSVAVNDGVVNDVRGVISQDVGRTVHLRGASSSNAASIMRHDVVFSSGVRTCSYIILYFI